MVKEIERKTSMSTCTGGRRDTQHRSEGWSGRHFPRGWSVALGEEGGANRVVGRDEKRSLRGMRQLV